MATNNYDPKVHGDMIRSTINKALTRIAIRLKSAIEENTPIASGALRKSFVIQTGIGDDIIAVDVGSPLYGKPEGYGCYVELGQKAHFAPIEPLVTWVREKLGGKAKLKKDFRVNEMTRRSQLEAHSQVRGMGLSEKSVQKKYKARKFDYDREVYRVARAVRFKIATVGVAEKLYIERALRSLGLKFVTEADAGAVRYYIDPADELMTELYRMNA